MRRIYSAEQRHRILQRWQRLVRPARLGTIRRTTPLSEAWGRDRGAEIDRFYIESFLRAHRLDIRGRVLEVKDSRYTDWFGSAVSGRDVVDIDGSNSNATIVADLARPQSIPDCQFDCFILTQTLQFLDDLPAAVHHIYRILRPGGVLLATAPGISRVERSYANIDYWRFTPASCRLVFSDAFGPEKVTVQSYGNVLSAMAFLTGMAREELTTKELAVHDPYFPVILGVRAIKRTEVPREGD